MHKIGMLLPHSRPRRGSLGFLAVICLAAVLCSVAEEAPEPEIKAHISFPFDKGMARANVPVFGVAWAKDFESYRVDFGEGPNPEKWTLVEESTTPQPKDPWAEGKVVWNPDWGTKGNLATWETGLDEYPYGKVWKHNLRGLYMLRLVVKARNGRAAEHRIEVTVARVVTNWAGGYAESPDKLASLHVKPDSLAGAFVLMSLLPSDQVPGPKDCVQIGRIYEFRPPDLKLLQPAKLIFSYGPDSPGPAGGAQAAISPEKLAILAYNAKLRAWQPLASTVDPEKRQVWAEIKETPSGVAFYGLFADKQAPAGPQLDPIGERVQRSVLKVTGAAEPLSAVIVSLNGAETEVRCGEDGRFAAEIRPRQGQNAIHAASRDHAGNISEPTPAQTFILEPKHPKTVKEIAILGGKEADWGRKMLVKVVGEDASLETDASYARIASSETDPVGFQADVVETGPTTGIYVALFEVAPHTDPAQSKIGARKDVEKIIVTWALDANVQASKPFRDRVPPQPPALSCDVQQVLVWNSFERTESTGQEQWCPYGGEEFGARLEVLEEQGLTFLRMRGRPGEEGLFGVSAWQTEYSVVQFPSVSFDCRILPTTEVDLLVNLSQPNVGWKGIRFTDDHPYYPRIGRFHGVVADLQWHRATVNLLAILRERFPGQPDYRVREIAFADWDGGERLFGTKHFGNSSALGGYFDVDNFLIGATCAKNLVTFRWAGEDESGIEGYSVLLDDKSDTVPPETLSYSPPQPRRAAEGEQGPETTSPPGSPVAVTWSDEKTYDELKDGQWWFHVRAKDRCGNWGRPNHYRLVVDTKPPELKLLAPSDRKLWFDEDIRIPLSDAGSGVDLDALELELDGQRLKVDGRSLAYDFYRGELRLRLREFKPYPVGFPDGSRVSISLCGVRDYAGNALDVDACWTFTAGSPVLASKTSKRGKNGWFLEEPVLEMHPLDQDEWSLTWMRSLKGDKYAEKGCFIREIGVLN